MTRSTSTEKVFEIGRSSIKRLQHFCHRTGDVGFDVVDVWDDEAAFAALGEITGPTTAQAGLDANPKVSPLHGWG